MRREALAFYRDEPNTSGSTWSRVMGWGNEDWELEHNFVQWMFPTDQPSTYNAEAPVLSAGEARLLSEDPEVRERFLASVGRFMRFVDETGALEELNHNATRLIRVARSIEVLGVRDEVDDWERIRDKAEELRGVLSRAS